MHRFLFASGFIASANYLPPQECPLPHFNDRPAIFRTQKVTSRPRCFLAQLWYLELNPFWSIVLSPASGPFWVLPSPQCILTPQLVWSRGCWSHSSLSQICEGESNRFKKSSRKWEGQSPLEEKARARSNLCLVLSILIFTEHPYH